MNSPIRLRDKKLAAGKFPMDAALAQRLVAAQFPQWADLPVTSVAADGWDNWSFRLGDTMKLRFPSAEGYAEQTAKEAEWLPRLAPHLPLAVPVPLAVGAPGADYPWPWAVYRWLEGVPASRAGVADPVQFAREIAGFIVALQSIDPTGGPPPGQHSFLRGAHPIAAYGEEARRAVDALAGEIDTRAAHDLLDAAAASRVASPVWVHGDIAVGNLLIRDGQLSSVIDFGCMAVGDPSCDLVLAWVFLDGAAREAFRAALPPDAGLWARARAWALWKAALVYRDGPGTPAEQHPREVIAAVIAEHKAAR
jgi:aminoglycoside phosphotransferase (APT) family kinase protein